MSAEKAAVSETAVTQVASSRRKFICMDWLRFCDRPGFPAVSEYRPVTKGKRNPIKAV